MNLFLGSKNKQYRSGSSDTSESTSDDTPTGTPTNANKIKNISNSASPSPSHTPRNNSDPHIPRLAPSTVKNSNQVWNGNRI